MLAKSAGLAAVRGTCHPRASASCANDSDTLRELLGDSDFERTSAEGGVIGVGEVVSCALAFADARKVFETSV
jgi:hypothetical protein